jgi:DNA-binding response OmpR family regulator
MSAASVPKEPLEAPGVQKRVLVQIGDPALSRGVCDALAAAGFVVHAIGSFKDLAAWLLLHGDATLVIALPAIDFFRKAVLREVRRIAPTVRIIALAASVTVDAQRDAEEAQVARLFTSAAAAAEIVGAIRDLS